MSERHTPPPLDELVDGDVSELRAVDAMLRAAPAPPPELPRSLREPVVPPAPVVHLWTRRRALVAVAAAAALAALFFGLGTRLGGDGFEEVRSYELTAAKDGGDASGVLRVGEPDAIGNRLIRLETSGLPTLPEGGYYVLWLEKDGEYAGTCGTFAGGEAQWTVSYPLWDYDAWVVSARLPGADPAEAPRVLEVPISS